MLTSFKDILRSAYHAGYGVGAFNCLSIENVMGAVKAAEELRSPLILQLAEVQFPYAPIEYMAPVMLAAAHGASVPVAVHLDHGQSLATCKRAIELGFNSVMFDGAHLDFDQNVQTTRQVVEIARRYGVSVEAELGRVGDAEGGGGENTGDASTADIFTDVEESASFLEKTGVDALAIAIGNLHGRYIATPRLNIERLRQISLRNGTPLVLHGGSGTSEEDFRACVRNGIAKVNIATAMQVSITDRLGEYLRGASNPGYIDTKWRMVEASRDTVAYHIMLFGSNDRL